MEKKKKKSNSFVVPISTQNIYALGSSSSEPLIHSRKKKYLGEREKKKKLIYKCKKLAPLSQFL